MATETINDFQTLLHKTVERVVEGTRVASSEVRSILVPHVPAGVLLRLATQQDWDAAQVLDVIYHLARLEQEFSIFCRVQQPKDAAYATLASSSETARAFRILERRLYHTYGIMMATKAPYRVAAHTVIESEKAQDREPMPIVDLLNRMLSYQAQGQGGDL